MPQRSKRPARRESDSLEAVKPLVVLGLLGMILYGAYTVIRRGPAAAPPDPGLAPPAVALGGEAPPAGLPSDPVAPAITSPASPAPLPTAPQSAPAIANAAPLSPPSDAAAVEAPAPLYLKAMPASPPEAGAVPAAPPIAAAAVLQTPQAPVDASDSKGRSAAFASAWTDAHEKLAAARYAEALSILSQWYDDPSLGPEETHRLEELLGQLAGTVIYSQQDHLLPPHIVAPGENLREIATSLQVPWQVLGKINGVNAPARLVPGEPLKVIAGPFDASVSLSRRRLSLQLKGNYAGSFPVVVGRGVHDHVGTTLVVQRVRRGARPAANAPVSATASTEETVQLVSHDAPQPAARQIVLANGIVIEATDDPAAVGDTAPGTSLVVSARDLDELVDILGDGSRVFVRP